LHEIVETDPEGYFFPGEFENPDNVAAQEISGEEIWEQTGGRLDAVVAAHGTGGWISGAARALKRHDAEIRAYAVEPAECALISEQTWGTHGVPGISDGIVPPNLDLGLMDGIVTVTSEDALDMARRLAREEGLFGGPSSGLNVAAALKVLEKHPDYERIVVPLPDTGQRYLSGELLGSGPDVDVPDRDHEIDPDSLERIEANRHRLEFIS
jgi:cysteine synthase A